MNDNKVQINIQRVYLKDLSFESPMTPDVFTNMSSSPKVGFNFESHINKLTDDLHELTLTFNVKAEVDDKTLYLVELKQCGVFLISTDNEDLKKIIHGANNAISKNTDNDTEEICFFSLSIS